MTKIVIHVDVNRVNNKLEADYTIVTFKNDDSDIKHITNHKLKSVSFIEMANELVSLATDIVSLKILVDPNGFGMGLIDALMGEFNERGYEFDYKKGNVCPRKPDEPDKTNYEKLLEKLDESLILIRKEIDSTPTKEEFETILQKQSAMQIEIDILKIKKDLTYLIY